MELCALTSSPDSGLFAFEQQLGAVPAGSTQQDRVRVGFVRSASGPKVLLAVVADGDGDLQAGRAAEIIINRVFEEVQETKAKDLNEALMRGLASGNKTIQQTASLVAATVVAIRNSRLYVAHTGHSMAFLVRDGKTTPLTQTNDNMLGSSIQIKIESTDPKVEALKPEDRIVLASDGLTRIIQEDGLPAVDPAKIAAYVEGNTPLDAARHLISIAMGRDVEDNVSVIVIKQNGRTVGKAKRWPLIAISLALVALLALAIRSTSWFQEEQIPELSDFGYAVIISGSASVHTAEGENLSAAKLSTIPALATLTVNEPTRLALLSNNSATTDITFVLLFLSPGSTLQLLSVDPQPSIQGVNDRNHQTVLSLVVGRLLIVRDGGSRAIQVNLEDGSASISGFGPAVLGIEQSGSSTLVQCLQGNCTFAGIDEDATALQARHRVSLIGGKASAPEPLAEQAVSSWNTLCGDCLSSP